MANERRRDVRPVLLGLAVLSYLVCTVFWPILSFEFVDFDVATEVLENPHIRGLTAENVTHILTQPCTTSYYPVRTLSFAADYQLRGLNPTGFKLTNALIHMANAYLVFWLILRIFRRRVSDDDLVSPWRDVAVAAFSASCFAIHPVIVEPVTWVCGREELLMAFWTLACVHLHLNARLWGQPGGKLGRAVTYHALAALCCLLACLSNAVAAVVPLLITTWDILMLGRPKLWRIFSGTAPLWTISIATVLVKRLSDDSDVTGIPGLFSFDGVMVVLNVYWLNLKALVWPFNLAMHYDWPYPRGFRPQESLWGGIAVLLTAAVLWRLRRKKLILFGVLWFGIALSPTLHLFVHHIYRADRYLYLPLAGLSVGLSVALASALTPRKDASNGSPLKVGRAGLPRISVLGAVVVAVLILGLLNFRSAEQVRTWENSLTAWENCILVSPLSVKAHAALGGNLSKRRQFQQAAVHLRTALEIDPRDHESLLFLLPILTDGPEDLRDFDLAVRMAERHLLAVEKVERDVYHAISRVFNDHAVQLGERGDFSGAIRYYYRAIEADSEYEAPRFNLAWLLATCEDAKWRDPPEAVRLAERACRLVGNKDHNGLMILAAAYSESGRREEAVSAAEKALGLAQTAGKVQLAGRLQGQLDRYRSNLSHGADPN